MEGRVAWGGLAGAGEGSYNGGVAGAGEGAADGGEDTGAFPEAGDEDDGWLGRQFLLSKALGGLREYAERVDVERLSEPGGMSFETRRFSLMKAASTMPQC